MPDPHPERGATCAFDDGEAVVLADGSRIPGWVSEDVTCAACGSPQVYHMDFDAHFCPRCNAWLESACDDPSCQYCPGRPERPVPGRDSSGPAAG